MAKRSSSRSSSRRDSSRPLHPVARPAAGRSVLRNAATMPFDRVNYRLLVGASLLIVLGYALMAIDNATADNPVDSALSLTVAPLLLLAGYVGIAVAVLWGVPRDATPADDAEALAETETVGV